MRVSDDRCKETDKIQMLSNFLKITAKLLGLSFYYRWNAQGKAYPRFEELLCDQIEELFACLGTVSKRLRELEVCVEAPFVDCEFDEPSSFHDLGVLAQDLSHHHYRLAGIAEEVAELCSSLGDGVSAEILDRRRMFHDKSAWLLSRFKS